MKPSAFEGSWHPDSPGRSAPPHENETDTLVVGAGPQALTLLARWVCDRPATVNELVVVDPAACWMRAWDDQFHRQQIDVLRSPGVHHPDPDEMAFIRRHAQQRASGSDATEYRQVHVGPLRRPTTTAFSVFCRDLAQRTGLWRRIRPGSVAELQSTATSGAPHRWAARLDDGSIIRCRQVVWAANPRRQRVPAGVVIGGPIVHTGDVDLDDVSPDERLAVLGGGQTAGQLALGADRAGARVVLIGRGPQRVADLDIDAGWLMDDLLAPFRAVGDPVQRRRIVEAARRGSMTADLAASLDRSGVERINSAGELAVRPSARGAVVELAGVELAVDRTWVATGSVPDLNVAPALHRLAVDGAPHVDGWPVLDEQLHWLDGLIIIGALAALTLGPAAGNLGGARLAADRLAEFGPTLSRCGPAPGGRAAESVMLSPHRGVERRPRIDVTLA